MNESLLTWLDLPDGQGVPKWTGNCFEVGGNRHRVIAYATGESGWEEELGELMDLESTPNKPICKASRWNTIVESRDHIQSQTPTILEIGCSSGYMLQDIREEFPDASLIGVDYLYKALERVSGSLEGIPLVQGDVTKDTIPENSVDAVVCLNVLEHVEDDALALQMLYKSLKPGGVLILEVPAMSHLFDAFDEYLQHFRRYDLEPLTRLVKKSGFQILKKNHLGFLPYIPFYLGKRKNQKLLGTSKEEQKKAMHLVMRTGASSKLLDLAFNIEKLLRRFVLFPCGVRIILTCRKPT